MGVTGSSTGASVALLWRLSYMKHAAPDANALDTRPVSLKPSVICNYRTGLSRQAPVPKSIGSLDSFPARASISTVTSHRYTSQKTPYQVAVPTNHCRSESTSTLISKGVAPVRGPNWAKLASAPQSWIRWARNQGRCICSPTSQFPHWLPKQLFSLPGPCNGQRILGHHLATRKSGDPKLDSYSGTKADHQEANTPIESFSFGLHLCPSIKSPR